MRSSTDCPPAARSWDSASAYPSSAPSRSSPSPARPGMRNSAGRVASTGLNGSASAAQEAADHLDAPRPVAALVDDEGHAPRRHLAEPVQRVGAAETRAQPELAGERVLVAVRHDEDVAWCERQGRVSRGLAPARTGAHDVIRHDVLGLRQEHRREHVRRRGLGHPRREGVHQEEEGAGEAHRLQHIRERVGGQRLAGRAAHASKGSGRAVMVGAHAAILHCAPRTQGGQS